VKAPCRFTVFTDFLKQVLSRDAIEQFFQVIFDQVSLLNNDPPARHRDVDLLLTGLAIDEARATSSRCGGHQAIIRTNCLDLTRPADNNVIEARKIINSNFIDGERKLLHETLRPFYPWCICLPHWPWLRARP
jgi:hypothetical protein